MLTPSPHELMARRLIAHQLAAEVDMKSVIPDDTLKGWLHPSENTLAWLAMVGIIPIALLALALVILSVGFIVIIALIALGSVWFVGRIIEAQLRGGAVEVNDKNFPEIAAQIRDVTQRLGYGKTVRAFVTQDGDINASLWRVFGRKYLTFNTGLVSAMSDNERVFVIGRFIGALRARHLRFHEVASFINSLERLWVLNILVLPYIRATVLSGDRIGMMACGDYEAAMSALDKFLLGNEVNGRLSPEGFMQQGRDLRMSIFRPLSVAFSTHPHMTDRYLELARFAYERDLTTAQPAAAPTPPWPAPIQPAPSGLPGPNKPAPQP